MLSAFKNFFITFLIAALVFGAAAYFATRFLTDTISGIFDMEANELDQILHQNSDTASPDAPVTEPPAAGSDGTDSPRPTIEGDSFNMLFIVTDYQPDIFSDYFPDEDTLTKMEDDIKNNLSSATDILGTAYRRTRACSILLLRADTKRMEYVLTPFPSAIRVHTASGDHSIADLYNLYGTDYLLSQISAMTGLILDHYLLVNVTELYEIVAELGGIPLYLSEEIYYNGKVATTNKPAPEEAENLPLLYPIGKTTVDAPGSVALMMTEDYDNGISERTKLMTDFFIGMMEKLTAKSEAELTAFYDSICEKSLIETSFTPKDMVSQIKLIRAFGSEDLKISILEYPGQFFKATETEAAYFLPNTASGVNLFKIYRPYQLTDKKAS